jgi:hypothetical protein
VLDANAAAQTCLGVALQAAAAVTEAGDDALFSGEDLLLAILADARPTRPAGAPFAPYGVSLPTEVPGAAAWPAGADGRDLLLGTDLGAALDGADEDIRGLQVCFIRCKPLTWNCNNALFAHLMDSLFLHVCLEVRLATVALSSAFEYGARDGDRGTWPPLALQDLEWARGMLLSRRFPVVDTDLLQIGKGSTEDGGGTWGDLGSLLPLLDSLNHGPDAVANLSWSASHHAQAGIRDAGKVSTVTNGGSANRGDVNLRNTAPLAAGEEALNNYGTDKSNEELLLMYGFTVVDNTADAVAFMVQSVNGPATRCLVGRSGITEVLWETLVAAVRGISAGTDEEDADSCDEEEVERIESEALALLRAALCSKLEAAVAAAQTLVVHVSPVVAARAKYATNYRTGIIEVLSGAIAECDAIAGNVGEC